MADAGESIDIALNLFIVTIYVIFVNIWNFFD